MQLGNSKFVIIMLYDSQMVGDRVLRLIIIIKDQMLALKKQ